jgi:hypothetical protein
MQLKVEVIEVISPGEEKHEKGGGTVDNGMMKGKRNMQMFGETASQEKQTSGNK